MVSAFYVHQCIGVAQIITYNMNFITIMCPSHPAPLDISRVPHHLLKSSITLFFPPSITRLSFITSSSNTDPLPKQFRMQGIFKGIQLCFSFSGSKFRLTVRLPKSPFSSTLPPNSLLSLYDVSNSPITFEKQLI